MLSFHSFGGQCLSYLAGLMGVQQSLYNSKDLHQHPSILQVSIVPVIGFVQFFSIQKNKMSNLYLQLGFD